MNFRLTFLNLEKYKRGCPTNIEVRHIDVHRGVKLVNTNAIKLKMVYPLESLPKKH